MSWDLIASGQQHADMFEGGNGVPVTTDRALPLSCGARGHCTLPLSTRLVQVVLLPGATRRSQKMAAGV